MLFSAQNLVPPSHYEYPINGWTKELMFTSRELSCRFATSSFRRIWQEWYINCPGSLIDDLQEYEQDVGSKILAHIVLSVPFTSSSHIQLGCNEKQKKIGGSVMKNLHNKL